MAACTSCATSLPANALDCPQCRQLVYSAELEAIARRAQELEQQGKHAAAADVWRSSLEKLPSGSQQAAVIRDRIASLSASAAAQPDDRPNWTKRLGPVGVAIAFLLKFKTVLFVILAKGKFLLLGLTKFSTLLSMFATMGVYWALYGWRFGIGFVIGIYIHEMGHVWMLRHYGLRASAPMFIPGFGAFVSMYDSPANVGQDARIGLAGPLWGAGAALGFLLGGVLTGGGIWYALANATAYINLFNLTPIWTLDGGRAFRALIRSHRLILLAAAVVLWLLTGEGILMIVSLGAAYRTLWQKDDAPEPDLIAFLEFFGLLLLFSAILALIPR